MGFSVSEMVAVTACGHTLGGVHSENFPQIVTPEIAPNNFVHFDSTTAFDNRIAVEFISGNTTDPLVTGSCIASRRCSDASVYAADDNATISAMANPDTFRSTCATVLQRMIEVVPSNVHLTGPILPYEVKPVGLQVSVLGGGQYLIFSGEDRIKTNSQKKKQISHVNIRIKDRNGCTACGDCTVSTRLAGTADGFDDSFNVRSQRFTLAIADSNSSMVSPISSRLRNPYHRSSLKSPSRTVPRTHTITTV